jgi:hypothetical protein
MARRSKSNALNRNSFMSIDDSVTCIRWQESRQDRRDEASQPLERSGSADLAYAPSANSAAHGVRARLGLVEKLSFFRPLTFWRGSC